MAGMDHESGEYTGGFVPIGSNQSGMRARNERLVLTILRRQGPLPKAEIARKTGLSAQTVSVIMRALEQDGLLQKGEKLRGKVGQPSVPMQLAAQGAYFLGLKVGRRSAELLLVDFVGAEKAFLTETYEYPTPHRTLEFAQNAVEKVVSHLPAEDRTKIAGLGIATPYFLWEWAETIGVEKAKMAAWQSFDLRAEVDDLFDFPVLLGNDATSACGAELVFGTAQTPPEFLYIYIGHFIGGGVVLNGVLYPGRSGNAGAIGPFPVGTFRDGPKQLVDTASLLGLERRVTAHGGDVQQLQDGSAEWDISEDIIDAWLQDIAPTLAQAVVGAVSIIDFPTVLIDGNMPTTLRDRVIESVRKEYDNLQTSGLKVPELRAGSLGPRARALGAASLPLAQRFMLAT